MLNTKQANVPKQVFYEKSAKTGLVISKTCTVCGEMLPLENFKKYDKRRDKYTTICKSCAKKAKNTPPTPEALAKKAVRDRWKAVGRQDLLDMIAAGMNEEEIAARFDVTRLATKNRLSVCGIYIIDAAKDKAFRERHIENRL